MSACLERGLHVYVDKPLSYEIEAARRMVERAREQGKLLAVGFNRRFAPLYTAAKTWLAEAGGLSLCIAQKHRTRLQSLTAKQTLYDDLIHIVDLLLWLGTTDYELTSWLQQIDGEGKLLHAAGSLRMERMVAQGRALT